MKRANLPHFVDLDQPRFPRISSYDKCRKCGHTNANERRQSPNDKSDFLARYVNAEQNFGGPIMCL